MKIFFILGVTAIILYFILRDNLVKTTGSNNKSYYTRKNQADIAVEQLVKIDDFLLKLNKLLVKEHPDHILIQKKLKKPIILKELPDRSDHIAYTINKTNLYICLRDKSGEFEDQYNRVYFVAMHELAHIITKSIGHTEEYWTNYRLVLKTAIDNGLYEYKNYFEEPVEFCNKKITSTPYVKGGNYTMDTTWTTIAGVGLLSLLAFIILNITNNANTNNANNINQTGCDTYESGEYGPEHPHYAIKDYDIWGNWVHRTPVKLLKSLSRLNLKNV